MKKILAVSGGIDSMVMLEMFRDDPEAIVAHFNHGTRPSAEADEEFVREAAERLGKRFLVGRGALGENVSEAEARKARYEFLREAAEGEIFTAHHVDDLLETMAINLIRGTGWRGMAPFGNRGVRRPFIETELLPEEFRGCCAIGKREIYEYAAERRIVYREDPTNTEERYLRNRVRVKIRELPKEDLQKKREGLMKIYHEVNNIRGEVDAILEEIVPKDGVFGRELFREVPDTVGLEILRFALLGKGITATRPQLADFLEAIRSYPAGKNFNLPKGAMVKMGKTSFRI